MSFQQGLSGLNVSAKALDTIGNNVANSGTVGFKSARAEFADVYASSLSGGGASQIGIGASLATVAQQFTQGNVTATNNPLDIAINGGGFFRMSNNGAITYTRNGQFQVDKTGYIVNAGGLRLQGYPAKPSATDPTGTIDVSSPVDIRIETKDADPKPTEKITTGLNLDSRELVPTTAPFNPDDPTSYNKSTSVTIYDSLGNAHVNSMYFVKTATPGQWSMYTALDGVSDNSTPGPAGPVFTAGSPTTLTFTTSGTISAPAAPVTFTVDLNSVATELGTTNSATPTQTFTIDFSSVTQFGSAFGVNNMVQDGYTSGRLSGLSVSADGVVQGNYSNGQSKKMGQIILAKFNNPNGLQSLGNNQWQVTSASGGEIIGAPGTGANGVIQSAAVEESNVDLTKELVDMITQQRAYQANAQTIKTQDQVMQTLVNLR